MVVRTSTGGRIVRAGAAPPGGPLRHLRVDRVHALIALWEAGQAEYQAIEARLFKSVPEPDDGGLVVIDFAEFDRRHRLIEAYGRPAHRAYVLAVRALDPDALSELIALAWLGRGDDADFAACCAYQRTFGIGERNVQYVLGKSAMPRSYWRAGLAKLGLGA